MFNFYTNIVGTIPFKWNSHAVNLAVYGINVGVGIELNEDGTFRRIEQPNRLAVKESNSIDVQRLNDIFRNTSWLSPVNHVRPTLAQRIVRQRKETLGFCWHVQCLLYQGRWTNIDRTNRWQYHWADEQIDVEPTSFRPSTLFTKCHRWSHEWLLSGL